MTATSRVAGGSAMYKAAATTTAAIRTTLRTRMVAVVHRAHAMLQHVRVNLRRREIRVAKHQLDCAQVGAALQQVRREGMTQHVRADGRAQACLARIRLEDLPEA